MHYCQRKPDGICWICKQPVAEGELRICGSAPAFTCKHLGKAVTFRSGPEIGKPVTVAVDCDTCSEGTVRLQHEVYECSLLKRCLPFYAPSDTVYAEFITRPDAIATCAKCVRKELVTITEIKAK